MSEAQLFDRHRGSASRRVPATDGGSGGTKQSATSSTNTNAFTVDVEDYFQVTAFERGVCRDDWATFPSRVVGNTHRLLEILAEHGVRGTFFILGWVAARYPQLVREIHGQGHEIGSHSYWHRLVYDQGPEEFREDLRRSRDILEDLTGEPVVAYRAPTFSITRRSLWALEILVEEGFRIDSSVFPIYHDRYGIPDARRGIHRIDTPSGAIWEFPPTVHTIGRWNLPVGGGGYFRLYPFWLTRYCLRRVQQASQVPFMFYTHPWELDANQPRLRIGTPVSRYRHYVRVSRTEDKLHRLFRAFRFGGAWGLVNRDDRHSAPTPPPRAG